jgi:hypothetical protein
MLLACAIDASRKRDLTPKGDHATLAQSTSLLCRACASITRLEALEGQTLTMGDCIMIVSTLTKALKNYFGYKPGQNLAEFMEEIKALTPEDKEYFKREFAKAGYEIIS